MQLDLPIPKCLIFYLTLRLLYQIKMRYLSYYWPKLTQTFNFSYCDQTMSMVLNKVRLNRYHANLIPGLKIEILTSFNFIPNV